MDSIVMREQDYQDAKIVIDKPKEFKVEPGDQFDPLVKAEPGDRFDPLAEVAENQKTFKEVTKVDFG